MNPVEQAFPPPDELKPKWADLFGIDPTYTDGTDPEQEQLRELVAENGRLRADLMLANQRIVALEARINRMTRKGGW